MNYDGALLADALAGLKTTGGVLEGQYRAPPQ
jgi:hypothetical protein